MSNKNIKIRFGVLALFVLLAASTRFLMIPNFSAIGAMGLFGAAYFSRKSWAFLVPFAALWVSDLVLNNVVYSTPGAAFMWMGYTWVYFAFALTILLGFILLKKVSPMRLLGASLLTSVVFFLVTNFGSFLSPIHAYPQNFSGLMAAYAAGIPFFWNTLLGDLFFVAVFFGSFELVQSRFPKLKLA